MFFLVAKLFWALLQPLSLAIVLGVVGLVAMLGGWRRTAIFPLALAPLTLALCAWTSIGAFLIDPLQDRFPRPDPSPAKVDGIVVLGGGSEGAINLARHGYELNNAGDRLVEALVLARRYPEAKLIVSGGNGMMMNEAEGDAVTAGRLFDAAGIPRERIILETLSRDTYENAVFTKRLVDPQPGQTWLLVTSAFHMPRSIGLFRRAGFEVVPWPVDYRTSGREGFAAFTDYPTEALQTTTVALREWVGLLAYWLSGRIDSPFPSPAATSPASTTDRASE